MKKIILLASVVTFSFAGFDSYFGGAITAQTNNPGFYQTQTRGLYSLGSTRIRFNGHSTFNPVHIEPPRMSFGCGGIDMVFGGFSYLNPDQMIEKLKAISSSAPAFAFQMALSTLCKDCQTIMSEIEKVTNMINNFSIDTCKASQRIGTAAAEWGMEAINSGLDEGQNNDFISSYNDAKSNTASTMADWGNTMGYYLGNNDLGRESVDTITLKGSLIETALTESGMDLTILGNDSDGGPLLVSLIRSMVGDIVGYNSNGSPTYMKILKKSANVNELLDGGDIEYLYVDASDLNQLPTRSLGTIHFDGLFKIFEDRITAIFNKMESKTSLDNTDISFIGSMPLPIYKYLNSELIAKTDNKDMIAQNLALLTAKDFLEYTTQLAQKTISFKIVNKGNIMDKKMIESEIKPIVDNCDVAREYINAWYQARAMEYENKQSMNDYFKSIEAQQKSKLLQTGLIQNFRFGK